MRVLHIVNVRWYNACAWYALMLCKGLKQDGHETALMGLPGSPPVAEALKEGIEVFEADINSSNPLKILSSIFKVRKALKKFRPDAVVCHRGEFFFYFTHVRFWEKPKWKLIRVRGDRRLPKTDGLSRWLYKNAVDQVVTSSEAMRRYHIENLNLPENKVHTIYGGVDTSVFKRTETGRHAVRKELGFSETDFVLGILGRFDPVKGHETLFKAAGELRKEGMSKLRLIVAGFDAVTTTDDIKKMLAENGIEDISVITGKRDDVPALISAMDLGVVPSLGSEAVCRVGMEMMACGLPVVGSDVGVIPEILPEQNVFRAGDKDSLKYAVRNYYAKGKVYDISQFSQLFKTVFS
jgi:glycosyltransferase involved in cell wall biosynthesis